MSIGESATIHRFVTIQQIVVASQPEATDLPTLLTEWGLTRSTQEAFWVIALDNVTGVKTVTEVARGGFHDVLVHIPTVLAAVVSAHTDRFYVAHNHPAGPVTPTAEDIALTAQIMQAANVSGLSFEDHIITGPKGWYSFWEEGLITRAEAPAAKHPRSRTRRDDAAARLPKLARSRIMPGYALLFLPGNPSHWFASTARGIRYLSLCGVDRRGKRYLRKNGPRVAQCGLCEGAGGKPVANASRRTEDWSNRG